MIAFPATATVKSMLRSNVQTLLLLISAACIFILFYVGSKHDMASTVIAVSTDLPASENQKPYSENGTTNIESIQTVNDVVAYALAFYNMLSASQQNTLKLTYTTTLAKKWSNLPCGSSCRNGIQLGTNLSAAQYAAAIKVVKAALSTDANNGYDEYHQMNLAEAYLHANGGGSGYDSTLRWMAFLNTPSTTGAWMLQFGGHHYAANIAFNNGHVIGATPFFMGLEPKTFTYNAVSYDPLGDERDALRAVFASLSSTQLTTSRISSSFSDCVMIPGESNNGAATFPSVAIGQPLSSLTTAQQDLVLAAIQLYVGDMDTATANHVMAVYATEISQTYIAYHGNGTVGNTTSFLVAQGDYMRISGPNVWIEFSCQGGVVIQGQIHYHTVWRDRSHDYGVNLSGPAIDGSAATGIDEFYTSEALRIYPNPSNSQITIQFPVTLKDAGAMVVNTASGQVADQIQHIDGTSFTYNMSRLPAGNYLLKVQGGGKVYTGKISRQ
jgi:Protein of unknown function (DUF3500)/Secretion system C-terminal sorting domain